ncbi:hypothetical protein CYMTET_3160 [Cymbomonas tetramitiformis]|uniref:Uncharacterized protein n=1 Tax=Cymbomonas tetramitiformis TaxID=36881 RepID=A0AAE0LL48_9CHLO|nr:hypothetical protein CYMTET_3160 [Cymbomonas tetramitiformis]
MKNGLIDGVSHVARAQSPEASFKKIISVIRSRRSHTSEVSEAPPENPFVKPWEHLHGKDFCAKVHCKSARDNCETKNYYENNPRRVEWHNQKVAEFEHARMTHVNQEQIKKAEYLRWLKMKARARFADLREENKGVNRGIPKLATYKQRPESASPDFAAQAPAMLHRTSDFYKFPRDSDKRMCPTPKRRAASARSVRTVDTTTLATEVSASIAVDNTKSPSQTSFFKMNSYNKEVEDKPYLDARERQAKRATAKAKVERDQEKEGVADLDYFESRVEGMSKLSTEERLRKQLRELALSEANSRDRLKAARKEKKNPPRPRNHAWNG